MAIHNFKTHFLRVLAGVAEDFPANLWDRLLTQTEITLNLLQKSNTTPNVSEYAHLSGPFDYNKMQHQLAVQHRYTKRQTNGAHGNTTLLTDGTCTHHRITTPHMHATSKPPRKNDSPAQLTFNTKE